jgi:hypothetical protein
VIHQTTCAVLGLLGVVVACACQEVRADPPRAIAGEIKPQAPAAATSTPARPSDADVLRAIADARSSLHDALEGARTDAARRAVRRRAAAFLERSLIDTVLPRWNGTAWDFSGTSITPGQGSIACGYFVSTTLGEAGLRVERARLAQQPSEDIIKTLVPDAAIARFSDVPVEKFAAAVASRGDGLYVVGLDIHVGFLIVNGGDVLFHHASYVGPAKVVREKAIESSPLVDSRYRVIGKLFTDDALIDAWLSGKPIPTKMRASRRQNPAR